MLKNKFCFKYSFLNYYNLKSFLIFKSSFSFKVLHLQFSRSNLFSVFFLGRHFYKYFPNFYTGFNNCYFLFLNSISLIDNFLNLKNFNIIFVGLKNRIYFFNTFLKFYFKSDLNVMLFYLIFYFLKILFNFLNFFFYFLFYLNLKKFNLKTI